MRPQLAQREREVAGRIGGDRDGLADDADPAGAARRGQCVPVRERGILVDEAARHDQVLRDAVGVVLAQGAQLAAGDLVELVGRDVIRDGRVVVARTGVLVARRAGRVRR